MTDDHYLPDLREFSKINIGTHENPVWVFVSYDRLDVSEWIMQEVHGA